MFENNHFEHFLSNKYTCIVIVHSSSSYASSIWRQCAARLCNQICSRFLTRFGLSGAPRAWSSAMCVPSQRSDKKETEVTILVWKCGGMWRRSLRTWPPVAGSSKQMHKSLRLDIGKKNAALVESRFKLYRHWFQQWKLYFESLVAFYRAIIMKLFRIL